MDTNPTRNNEIAGSIPGLAQWVKDLCFPELSQTQLRAGVAMAAVAPIRPLAWELPYAPDATVKKKK